MLALIVGNSRYHWAWFENSQLRSSWDTPYFSEETIARMMSGGNVTELFHQPDLPTFEINQTPIYLASVVPSQTEIWQKYPQVRLIELTDLPLTNLYPTLGIDRGLAVVGAGATYGYPVLVIDGGTALTFTGVDESKHLVGGAIIPGLKLQIQSLALGTAALSPIELPSELPPRWSRDTEGAIASGILHTTIAGVDDFITNWWGQFPDTHVIFTGGDGATIVRYLHDRVSNSHRKYLTYDRDAIFKGIQYLTKIRGLNPRHKKQRSSTVNCLNDINREIFTMVSAREYLPRFTPEEYFAWEEQQLCRHEYINGEVYAMSGGTQTHSRIALKFGALLDNHLADGGCRVFNSDCKVNILETNDFTYPDVSVSCDPRDQTTTQYITYPCLIVEVLSDSTEAYDRGKKFWRYHQNPKLQDYVLVSSKEIAIDLYHKNKEGRWEIINYQTGDIVELQSVGLSFPIEQIYRGITFTFIEE